MEDEGAHSFIVLKDQAEVFHSGALVKLERGHHYIAHSHVITPKHHNLQFICSGELAPLSRKECVILDAIASDSARHFLYRSPGKLKWAVGLKVGDRVLAQLPDKSGHGSSDGGPEYVTAVIKWAGMTDGGWTVHHFGVEITVSIIILHAVA